MDIKIGNKNIENYLQQANEDLSRIKENRVVSEFSDNIEGLRNKIQTLLISAETVSFNYNTSFNRCELYSKVGNIVATDYFNVDADEYDDLCTEDFNIDVSTKYNHSGWKESETGDLIRIFAITQPISKHPNVTLNIARKPLGDIQQKEFIPLIEEIFSSNFIIVGATGSGKTYLLNNCLMRVFNKKPNRILLIEEFHELFKPNKHTSCLDIPPCKPGEIPVFDYVISQTNLMRVQNIFVGEIKGKEAWPFVLNLASGTFGGCTMHGKSCEDGLSRLQMLMATAGVCDRATCGRLISKSIKYVVYVDKHRVADVQKLTGVFNEATNKWQTENIM